MQKQVTYEPFDDVHEHRQDLLTNAMTSGFKTIRVDVDVSQDDPGIFEVTVKGEERELRQLMELMEVSEQYELVFVDAQE